MSNQSTGLTAEESYKRVLELINNSLQGIDVLEFNSPDMELRVYKAELYRIFLLSGNVLRLHGSAQPKGESSD